VFFAVAVWCGAALVSSAQQTVALYTFDDGTFNSSAESSLASASALSADVVASRSGITGTVPRSYYERDYTNFIPGTTLDAAIAANNYLGFTVIPNSGPLSYVSLSFEYGVSNGTSLTSYTVSWAVFAGEVGFTAVAGDELATGSFSLASQGANNVAAFWAEAPANIDLSAVAGLQDTSAPMEFRIYYWDDYTTGNNNLMARFDTIELTAASAIPEPGTYAAMFGAAALGLVLWRRRNRSVQA